MNSKRLLFGGEKLEGRQRFGLALNLGRLHTVKIEMRLGQVKGALAHQYLPAFSQAFQARSQVDGVSDKAVGPFVWIHLAGYHQTSVNTRVHG